MSAFGKAHRRVDLHSADTPEEVWAGIDRSVCPEQAFRFGRDA